MKCTMGISCYKRIGWPFLLCGLGVLLVILSSVSMAASYSLYKDEFDQDLAVWSVQGAWRATSGALVTTGETSMAWMGRRDWRDYVVDARVRFEDIAEDGYFCLLGRRQKNGDAFALELSRHELRLIVIEGDVIRVLARTPITLTCDQPHFVRLGLFQETLFGQFDNESMLTASIDATTATRYPAGQIGVAAQGIALAVEAIEALSLESAVLPRSGIRPDPGYLPPGTAQSAGARDIMLIYTNYHVNRSGEWTVSEAIPYLAYVRNTADGMQFVDWFFDSFLFLALVAPSGRAFDSSKRAAPANLEDWQWYLDFIFQEQMQLGAFNEGVAFLKSKLQDADYRAKVIIMIPHAMATQSQFGDVDNDGKNEDFSPTRQGVFAAEEARWKAVSWYIATVERRWKEAGYNNLELVGYYWLDEHLGTTNGLSPDTLTQRTSEYLHAMGRKLFWIPYFRASRYETAYDIGFDAVLMQPNYMFNTSVPHTRFAALDQTARHEYFGVEIEADGTVLASPAGRERYLDYLRAGVTYGYMKDALHAYYQGGKVFLQAFYSWDPEVRAIYDATYAFVKGTFSEQLPTGK